MPGRFALEFQTDDGEWMTEAVCVADQFERLDDGSYICSRFSSGLWVRCVKRRATTSSTSMGPVSTFATASSPSPHSPTGADRTRMGLRASRALPVSSLISRNIRIASKAKRPSEAQESLGAQDAFGTRSGRWGMLRSVSGCSKLSGMKRVGVRRSLRQGHGGRRDCLVLRADIDQPYFVRSRHPSAAEGGVISSDCPAATAAASGRDEKEGRSPLS
jgi:hypothetical protein